jgi:hypothetical protein
MTSASRRTWHELDNRTDSLSTRARQRARTQPAKSASGGYDRSQSRSRQKRPCPATTHAITSPAAKQPPGRGDPNRRDATAPGGLTGKGAIGHESPALLALRAFRCDAELPPLRGGDDAQLGAALSARPGGSRRRRLERHVPPHELVEARNGEIDVTVVLGGVDKTAVQQFLPHGG